MAIKRKVRRKLDKRTQRLSVRRSNRQLYRMIQVMSIIGTLVIANVLFTMVTKTHIWSQENVLNSKISSSMLDFFSFSSLKNILHHKSAGYADFLFIHLLRRLSLSIAPTNSHIIHMAR